MSGPDLPALPIRIETDADSVARDLLRLVLTLVELVRQLMERQAIRRLDELDEAQADALGTGLLRLQEAIDELREAHGLRPEDLDIDLGPFGTLLAE